MHIRHKIAIAVVGCMVLSGIYSPLHAEEQKGFFEKWFQRGAKKKTTQKSPAAPSPGKGRVKKATTTTKAAAPSGGGGGGGGGGYGTVADLPQRPPQLPTLPPRPPERPVQIPQASPQVPPRPPVTPVTRPPAIPMRPPQPATAQGAGARPSMSPAAGAALSQEQSRATIRQEKEELEKKKQDRKKAKGELSQ